MSDVDGKFPPYRPGELDDIAQLPGQFRSFAAEVRSSFELLGNRIIPALVRIESTMVDLATRISDIEKQQIKTAQRLDDLEARMLVSRKRTAKR